MKSGANFKLGNCGEPDSGATNRPCVRYGRSFCQKIQLISESLRALGMGEKELLPLCKGDWRKRVIAHRVREQTSVSLRWLGARLQMGSEGHVSRVSASLEDIATAADYRSYEKQRQRNARKKDRWSFDPVGRS